MSRHVSIQKVSHTLKFRKVRSIGMCPASAQIMFLVPDQAKSFIVASPALLLKTMIFGYSSNKVVLSHVFPGMLTVLLRQRLTMRGDVKHNTIHTAVRHRERSTDGIGTQVTTKSQGLKAYTGSGRSHCRQRSRLCIQNMHEVGIQVRC